MAVGELLSVSLRLAQYVCDRKLRDLSAEAIPITIGGAEVNARQDASFDHLACQLPKGRTCGPARRVARSDS